MGRGRKDPHRVANAVGLVVVVLVFGGLLYGFFTGSIQSPRRRGTTTGTTTSAAPGTAAPGTAAPGAAAPGTAAATPRPPGQAWEYDPLTNQHYNPLPGHEHWHQGAAPAPGEQGRPIDGAPPAEPPEP